MSEPSASRLEPWRKRLQHLRSGVKSAAPFAFGVLAALAALLLYNVLFPGPQALTAREVNDTVAQALASATPPPAFSTRVYQAIQPSLVLIQTKSPAAEGEDPDNGLGSGLVIDFNGDILTSLHVVANSSEILVTFADGTQSPAVIIAEQPENDIAVLQALQPSMQVIPATLGNPNAMRVGDEAFVVGNPFGLYSSMSAGVISGFNRSFQPTEGAQTLEGLIQIDAAVNPPQRGAGSPPSNQVAGAKKSLGRGRGEFRIWEHWAGFASPMLPNSGISSEGKFVSAGADFEQRGF